VGLLPVALVQETDYNSGEKCWKSTATRPNRLKDNIKMVLRETDFKDRGG